MHVVIELFVCAYETKDIVRYHRSFRNISDRKEDPDVILAEALAETGLDACRSGACAHSTSWRYENGKTILTYLVWVEADALIEMPSDVLSLADVACPAAAGPLTPRPKELDEKQVLAHGLRHLSDLVCNHKDAFLSDAAARTHAAAFLSRVYASIPGRIN